MSTSMSMHISLPLTAGPFQPASHACGPAITPELQQAVLKLVATILKQVLSQLGGGADGAPQGACAPSAGNAPAGLPTPAGGGSLMTALSGLTGQVAADRPPAARPDGAKPSGKEAPPAGKSAQDIIGANPALAQLDPTARDMVKKQFPDYEKDPTQAFNASRVIDWIKSSRTADGKPRSDTITKNGKVEGFTKDKDARHGTEAGLLKDFSEKGFNALKDDHRLDKTKDRHVRTDGTNRNNDAVNLERAGEALVFLPGLSNVLKGMGKADRDHEASAGEVLKGGLDGIGKTLKNNAKGAIKAIATGNFNPVSIVGSMYKANVVSGVVDDIKMEK